MVWSYEDDTDWNKCCTMRDRKCWPRHCGMILKSVPRVCIGSQDRK